MLLNLKMKKMETNLKTQNNNNKVVYIVTTAECSACKCMENILDDIQKDNSAFTITSTDFTKVPEWLKTNIILTDFPTVVFIDNNVIKYHFVGTKSKSKVLQLMKYINF